LYKVWTADVMPILALIFMSREKYVDFKITKFVFSSFHMLLLRWFWYLLVFSICDGNMTLTVILYSLNANEMIHKYRSDIHPYGTINTQIHWHGTMWIYIYFFHKFEGKQKSAFLKNKFLHTYIRLFNHILVNSIFTYLDIKRCYIKYKSSILGCNFPNEMLKDLAT
jgi:hypothetical protein